MLPQVLPTLACGDVSDLGLLHAELGRDIDVAMSECEVCTDGADLLLSQFYGLVQDAGLRSPGLPLLGIHIGDVVLMSADEQMRWIDAGRVVAVMADDSVWRQCHLVVQFVGYAVGSKSLGVANVNYTIAKPIFSSLPWPTAIGMTDESVLPEAISEGSAGTTCARHGVAISPLTPLEKPIKCQ